MPVTERLISEGARERLIALKRDDRVFVRKERKHSLTDEWTRVGREHPVADVKVDDDYGYSASMIRWTECEYWSEMSTERLKGYFPNERSLLDAVAMNFDPSRHYINLSDR